MCGIAGILDSNNSAELYTDLMRKMVSRISYRGPDESGIYIGEGIVLGHVRLSIIDVASGQQPMSSADKNLWIVFNGEIFNYKELRDELIGRGHKFITSSDTEVLLHSYQEYGVKCLEKLNGQFVFAIWDNYKQELLIARDRVGIRPLFYYKKDNLFLFASEIKSILEYSGISPEINEYSLSQIFTFWSSLTPGTIFKDIVELSPGHYLKLKKNKLEIVQYWKLNFGEQVSEMSFDAALSEFGSLLYDAVKIRLRADVPVAAYLSGGLDSSATTSLIKSIVPQQLQTYSIGFIDKEFDETPYQQAVSKKLKTNHNAFYCSSKEISESFPSIIWHAETPLTRTAPAPMYLLSKKVRAQNIKVVITGEGADEMLGGYDIFKESLIRHFWSRQPQSQIRPLLFKRLYAYIPLISGMNAQMLKFVYGLKLEEVNNPFYSHLLRWHNTGSIQKYFSNNIRQKLLNYNSLEYIESKLPSQFNSWDYLEKAQWLETTIFLSGYLLSSQGDRMAMANSVEGRYPFLDYRVIEFCSRIPSKFKLNGLNEKFILKKLVEGKLPESVIKRPKQAYRAPIITTFITDPPEYLRDILDEKAINRNGLFNYQTIHSFFNNIRNGKIISEIDAMAITGIISTQLFAEIYLQNSPYYKPELNLINPKIQYQPKLN